MVFNNKKIWALIIILPVIILIMTSYIHYKMIQIDNSYVNEFREKLELAVKQENSFRLNDVTPFEWDRVIMIRPYTSKKEMEQMVGKKWTTHQTYLGYLFEKSYFGKYPIEDDAFHKLLFIKGDEVVLDATLMKSEADFTQINSPIDRKSDRIIVTKGEYQYPYLTIEDIE